MDFRPHRLIPIPIPDRSGFSRTAAIMHKNGVPDILHQLDDDSMADVYTPMME